MGQMFSLGTPEDVCYVSMPMFHSNALMAGWAPALADGSDHRIAVEGTLFCVRVPPRRTSKYGVTYFNYVGKPLSYILATPELPDDAENIAETGGFGNEAATADVEARFAERSA